MLNGEKKDRPGANKRLEEGFQVSGFGKSCGEIRRVSLSANKRRMQSNLSIWNFFNHKEH
jgi:hypothetical protein